MEIFGKVDDVGAGPGLLLPSVSRLRIVGQRQHKKHQLGLSLEAVLGEHALHVQASGSCFPFGPTLNCAVSQYISGELPDWSFDVEGIRVLAMERTYGEKLLILYGLYHGYEGEGRLPIDRDLLSRHFYDVAMITVTETGRSALSNTDMLDAVRQHNLIAFRQAWKRFEKAVPGSVRLVPQSELRSVIERDYRGM